MYLISACLLGDNCKYNGGNNANKKVIEFAKTHPYMKVCPEVAGGLPTPRPPAEIQCRPSDASSQSQPNQTNSHCAYSNQQESKCYKICNVEGVDVTENFLQGAQKCLEEALDAITRSKSEAPEQATQSQATQSQSTQIQGAILKAKSPSCGSGLIYDGTFSGTLIEGDGVFAAELKKLNIKVITEKEL